jgi:putative colanic acid biosynthesis UDP-glucose lipid carrier transferase
VRGTDSGGAGTAPAGSGLPAGPRGQVLRFPGNRVSGLRIPAPRSAARSSSGVAAAPAPHASPHRNFHAAPASVPALLSALADPMLAAAGYLALAAAFGGALQRADLVFALLVLALSGRGRDRSAQPLGSALADIAAAFAVLAGLLLLCGLLTDSLRLFDPRVLAAWALLTPLSQGLALAAGQAVLRRLRADPARRRRAIVVGAGPLAARVSSALRHEAARGVDLLAFFDDRDDARLDPAAVARRQGRLRDVAGFVRREGVHEVYVALPLASGTETEGASPRRGTAPADAARAGRMAELLQALQGTTASVFHVPDILGLTVVQGRLQDVGGVPVVGLCESPFTGVNALVKRAEDLVLASVILVLIAPLLAAVALGVKLSSPGPVIFRQRRHGLDGREIVVWKFRSMRALDDGAVVRQATRDDPRVTRFGAFIRRTSLDELPQFFNVLQGRMSIVGPRPHALAHTEQYRALIGPYMVRHKVKPGITGWAQVNGLRGETDTVDKMRARVEHDLEYLHRWSLTLDLRIVARTVALMLFDRRAY